MSPSYVLPEKITKDLEDLRHTLLNGTIAIAESLYKIEQRLAYMSEALKIFSKTLENDHEDSISHEKGD